MPTEIFGPVSQGPASVPVTPAQGGTGTTTVFTPGSIVYAGASGVYSQDNATLFHNDATNQNGLGTNLPSATLEIADTTVLGSESLTNPGLTAGASWSVTGGFALAANAATYTHATGVGTLTQASGTLAIAGIANNLYAFTYTISGLSAFLQIPVVTITTGFALAAVPLVINQAGTYTVIFRSAAVPGNFVIGVTSNQAGAFTMDTFSLKHVIGGNLTVNGNAQVNGTLTATALAGPLTGNASSATVAATETIVDDVATAATMYPAWVTANTGNLPAKVSSTKLSFVPSTGVLTATGFSGPLTGNASTATALATPRAINGVNFDGSAPITVTADASTLSGTTLKSTVVNSSLTSVGTLAGLTVTAAPTFSALTAGSVPFAGAAGLLSQDNANVRWDNINKWLALGSSTDHPAPEVRLSVVDGTPMVGSVAAPSTQLRLARSGTAAVKYGGTADFKIGTYAAVLAAATQLDIALGQGGVNVPDVTVMTLLGSGSVLIGTAALGTTATDGFLYIPSCAGAPTGVPTTQTGRVPMIYDSTNNVFYIYTGGAWKQPKVAGVAAPFA